MIFYQFFVNFLNLFFSSFFRWMSFANRVMAQFYLTGKLVGKILLKIFIKLSNICSKLIKIDTFFKIFSKKWLKMVENG